MRFSPEVVERLLEIRWWDWEDAKVAKAIPLLLSSKVDEFIAYAKQSRR